MNTSTLTPEQVSWLYLLRMEHLLVLRREMERRFSGKLFSEAEGLPMEQLRVATDEHLRRYYRRRRHPIVALRSALAWIKVLWRYRREAIATWN